MKNYVLLLLMMAGAHPGFSQGRDTAFAVHKLFREKRGTGESLQAVVDTVAAGTQYVRRADARPTAQEVRQDALASAAFAGVGLVKASRYSAANEAAVLQRYREGWSIPPDIRRKLRRKHFHETARDVIAP